MLEECAKRLSHRGDKLRDLMTNSIPERTNFTGISRIRVGRNGDLP
jgi:hypothetical protein